MTGKSAIRLAAVAAGLAAALWPAPAGANGKYDVKKTASWRLSENPTMRGRYGLHAYAEHAHGGPVQRAHEDKPKQGDQYWDNEAKPKKWAPKDRDGNPVGMRDGNGVAGHEGQWSRWFMEPLGALVADAAVADVGAKHARAESHVEMSARKHAGTNIAQSSLHLWGSATAKCNGNPFAEAAGVGEMTVSGVFTKGEVFANGVKSGLELGADQVVRASGYTAAGPKSAVVRDPMYMEVLDLADGSLLAREDLLEQVASASGVGSVEWTSAGLVLRADAGSEAHFSLRTLSAWIATPLNGAATLSGSALVASGALGAYTWFVETDSQGLTTATASFGSNLSFDIDIPSTVFAALVGDAEVRAGSDVHGYCYAVPETGLPALGLAVLGLAGLAGQRRRNTRRGA